jgi:N-acetylglucosaminyldiphosphoundecaprenol N-acetyl-beta-D-mannosaminyltransferase
MLRLMNGKKHRSDATLTAEAIVRHGGDIADVLGVDVCKITVAEFIQWITDRAQRSSDSGNTFVTYLNAACSNIAVDDAEYKAILDSADCVYADGQAIVWAAKAMGDELPERVNAGDFTIKFCEELAARGLKLALVGGRPGVAEKAVEVWKQRVPDLQVVGCWDGFFDDEGEAVAREVAASGADVLLMGMGVPLQEKWAWSRRPALGVKVIWCVGALFEYYGEGRARAPVWVRRVGMEWFFRLMLEPRRLWKRYLVGNVRFVWRVMRARRSQNR